MKPTIRVLYLCELPTLLGGERSLLQFLLCCKDVAIHPIVLTPAVGPLKVALTSIGVETIDWTPASRETDARLINELRSRQIQLVHGNSLMIGDAAAAIGKTIGVPAVTHVRDIMRLSDARASRLNTLARLIAVSNAVGTSLRNSGIAPERIVEIPNGVDPESLRSDAAGPPVHRELGLAKEAPLVGCVGQIALRKGQDTFLEAAELVARQHPDAEFLIVGERYSVKAESIAYEGKLRRLAVQESLKGRVHFLGYRHDVPRILRDLSILVVPSRQEPLSRVLLEGLALGVPSIATAVGGSPEILMNGEVAPLVPANAPELMAAAIIDLLENPDDGQTASARGLERARSGFSPHSQAVAIRELYESILDHC